MNKSTLTSLIEQAEAMIQESVDLAITIEGNLTGTPVVHRIERAIVFLKEKGIKVLSYNTSTSLELTYDPPLGDKIIEQAFYFSEVDPKDMKSKMAESVRAFTEKHGHEPRLRVRIGVKFKVDESNISD